ncbi:MAG: FKBP-type peptidyl-prolyl cis-trans isomerase [Candidatus Cryptobacteroides sp.]|nr:FKBP-type peptidyl-prolyl cis-trans isomerase [Bacteroidales bacterium]MDY3226358.1 FKBP-type peptidyl-prolyl cis-trans isomerase [Candidatus Cryptobacteroides sp.]MDD7154039.1 FKBP-type peptidyl-prolyl cis-trans isomerase [Bacteroidales bacterium]MDY4571614.1 FKBP-type peptidyl-prolyl cis-trans isomerase [Candidatus Cryptobacteroides sp.]MDY5443551.1 FKBP-type peptidyl-prolyl cis-trans isomerase [Candidatus Cryptobacteroides sp.]
MDKNSYALGMSIAHNMLQSGVREISFDDFTAGLKAALTGAETAITYEEAGTLLDEFFGKIQEEQAARQAEIGEFMKKDGETFLAANAKKEGVTVLPSGLQYKVLKSGEGRKPGRTDKVRCHYEGTFPNGQKFDSSYDRNEPAVFGVNQVIAGWTEALQLMSEGSAWELYIPYNLAYGEAGAPGAIPPYSALVFKVELIEVL